MLGELKTARTYVVNELSECSTEGGPLRWTVDYVSAGGRLPAAVRPAAGTLNEATGGSIGRREGNRGTGASIGGRDINRWTSGQSEDGPTDRWTGGSIGGHSFPLPAEGPDRRSKESIDNQRSRSTIAGPD